LKKRTQGGAAALVQVAVRDKTMTTGVFSTPVRSETIVKKYELHRSDPAWLLPGGIFFMAPAVSYRLRLRTTYKKRRRGVGGMEVRNKSPLAILF